MEFSLTILRTIISKISLVAFLLSQIYVKAIPDITIISFLSIDHSLDSVRLVTRVLFVHT